jgi:hypothetical protein
LKFFSFYFSKLNCKIFKLKLMLWIHLLIEDYFPSFDFLKFLLNFSKHQQIYSEFNTLNSILSQILRTNLSFKIKLSFLQKAIYQLKIRFYILLPIVFDFFSFINMKLKFKLFFDYSMMLYLRKPELGFKQIVSDQVSGSL